MAKPKREALAQANCRYLATLQAETERASRHHLDQPDLIPSEHGQERHIEFPPQ